MRSLVLLVLGALAGVVATVMLQTLDPDGATPPPEASGGGNARISFDEDALIALLSTDLGDIVPVGSIKVAIEARGVIKISVRGIPPDPISVDLILDPDLTDGRFRLTVIESHGSIPLQLVEHLENALSVRLQTLAGLADYRVTAITTAGRRLEIEIKM